jgi:hypothetical protein
MVSIPLLSEGGAANRWLIGKVIWRCVESVHMPFGFLHCALESSELWCAFRAKVT